MSNKLAKMRKDMTPSTNYTKDRVYGRVEPTNQVINKIKQECTNEAVNQSYACFLAFADQTLRNDLGFGDYMARIAIDGMITRFEAFQRGDTSMNEIIQYMAENMKETVKL